MIGVRRDQSLVSRIPDLGSGITTQREQTTSKTKIKNHVLMVANIPSRINLIPQSHVIDWEPLW